MKIVKYFYIRPFSIETSNFSLDIPTMVSPLNAFIHPERVNSLILLALLTAIIQMFFKRKP